MLLILIIKCRAYKVVKEIVVDPGNSIEVPDRARLCAGIERKMITIKQSLPN